LAEINVGQAFSGPLGLLDFGLVEHRLAEIHAGDGRASGQRGGQRERHVPASGCQIEDRARLRVLHGPHQASAPPKVDASAEEPVGQVIAAGNPPKHGIYGRRIRHG
jgi:hypothetical protein